MIHITSPTLTAKSNIPSPIPMRKLCELTINEPQCLHEMNVKIMSIESVDSNCSSDEIIHILNQYGQYTNYATYSIIIVNGYIRDLASEITSIIPSDIEDLCFSFYYEKQNEYIHLVYRLYNISATNHFSGKELVSIIESNHLQRLQNQNESVINICNQLLKFNFIQLISYQTRFSSLFDNYNQERKSIFNASDKYLYDLTQHIIFTVEQYSNLLSITRAE